MNAYIPCRELLDLTAGAQMRLNELKDWPYAMGELPSMGNMTIGLARLLLDLDLAAHGTTKQDAYEVRKVVADMVLVLAQIDLVARKAVCDRAEEEARMMVKVKKWKTK